MEQAPFSNDVAEGPDSGSAYWLRTDDDVRIRVGLWPSENAHKGTIFVFPGRTEYIEKYGRTASQLCELGYSTFLIDWRGQGLSDRATEDPMTGHVVNFSDYHKDVAAMLKAADELDLPKPWYLFGHSLGACIALRSLKDGLPVSACAFTGPMWDISLPKHKRIAAWPLCWAAKRLHKGHLYAPGTEGVSYVTSTPFPKNRLTHDLDMYQYFIHHIETLKHYQLGGPSMGWLFEILNETKKLSTLESPNTPCITFCGEEDILIDIGAVKKRMTSWPNGTLKMVPKGKHDLMSELPEIRNSLIEQIDTLFSNN